MLNKLYLIDQASGYDHLEASPRGMSTATALKFQNDAKQLAAKRLQERKKGLLVLILRHLADYGYRDAYKRLETEAGLSLDQVNICDFVTPIDDARLLSFCCLAWLLVIRRVDSYDAHLLQVDAAQNLSLLSILQDYEEQFEFKYGRKPQLLQKCSSLVSPVVHRHSVVIKIAELMCQMIPLSS